MQTLRSTSILTVLTLMVAMAGCATPQGHSQAEKRNDVQAMRTEALDILYRKVPRLRSQIVAAPGYGVFSGYSTQTIFMSTGNGFGVIRDNSSGTDTYMRAVKLGGGLGAGLQDVYAVVVFRDSKTMHDMLRNGWGITGKAEAAAKIGDVGDSGAVVLSLPGMDIYRFAKNGIMLGGAIEGARVWPDDELN